MDQIWRNVCQISGKWVIVIWATNGQVLSDHRLIDTTTRILLTNITLIPHVVFCEVVLLLLRTHDFLLLRCEVELLFRCIWIAFTSVRCFRLMLLGPCKIISETFICGRHGILVSQCAFSVCSFHLFNNLSLVLRITQASLSLSLPSVIKLHLLGNAKQIFIFNRRVNYLRIELLWIVWVVSWLMMVAPTHLRSLLVSSVKIIWSLKHFWTDRSTRVKFQLL